MGQLQWNTFLGGSHAIVEGFGIASDPSGNAYVSGRSVGDWGAPVHANSAGVDGFVAIASDYGSLTPYRDRLEPRFFRRRGFR